MQKISLAQNLVHYMIVFYRLTCMYTAFITADILIIQMIGGRASLIVLQASWQILHSIPLYIIEHRFVLFYFKSRVTKDISFARLKPVLYHKNLYDQKI